MPELIEVAHVALEYKAGVGGIKAVTTGLLPALANSGTVKPSIITPFYDVYNEIYRDQSIEHITTVTHIYKGKPYKSDVFRICTEVINEIPVYHYLIKPVANSPVAWIFKIGDEKALYQSFSHSESGNRLEYFNGAAAIFIRTPNVHPVWDIVHGHTWHTALTGCLVKELDNLPLYKDILKTYKEPLNKIPYVISTIHMLRKAEHGVLNSQQAVKAFIESVGLPSDFASQFPYLREHINENHLKRVVLALVYADTINAVSRGLAAEIVSGNGEGLDCLLVKKHSEQRLYGITNGIDVANWIATNPDNLHEFAFNPETISADKQRLKTYLATKYPQLDPRKKWLIFVGRFANEKGIEYLQDLLATAKKNNANLIVLGTHIALTVKNGKKVSQYQELIDAIRSDPNAVVIDNDQEQRIYGKLLRAGADCAVSLSKNEACGLVPMELMTCGAIAVVPNIQGLPDTVISLTADPENGTGFLYNGSLEMRQQNLDTAVQQALAFLADLESNGTLDQFLQNLLLKSLRYDWQGTPAHEYETLYQNVMARDLLTTAQIKQTATTTAPILVQFNANKPTPKPIKVWQIGFNKCGSTTLYDFFWKNGILSLQHGNQGDLATSMYYNFLNGKPLLSEKFSKYQAFFDMENIYDDPPTYIATTLFKELDRQYPGSKFILNTRNKTDWIESRRAHVDHMKGISYVTYLCNKYGISEADLIERWSKEWDEHHRAVLEYFKDRPEDLLVFDINNDGPETIQQFFKDYFDMDPDIYEQKNKGFSNKLRAAM